MYRLKLAGGRLEIGSGDVGAAGVKEMSLDCANGTPKPAGNVFILVVARALAGSQRRGSETHPAQA